MSKKIKTDLFDFAWMESKKTKFDDFMNELSQKALHEDWGENNKILKNYLSFTFKYLAISDNESENESNYFSYAPNSCCFNTGLFDKYFNPIYAFFKTNNLYGIKEGAPEWFFIGFKTESDIELNAFSNLPDRMNYFKDPIDLVFDYNTPLRVNVPHIIDDEENRNRLPDNIKDLPSEIVAQLFTGAIDIAVKKAKANYSIAVPQFYRNSLQLLLPISFNGDGVDLALAIQKKNNIYTVRTCLTTEMAYNNARLISKPQPSWLKP